MSAIIPTVEIYERDGRETVRLNRINSQILGRNIAARIGRALQEIPENERTIYALARELKRYDVDLRPRYSDGELRGVTYSVQGASFAASAISNLAKIDSLKKAGFTDASSQEERDWLVAQSAVQTTGLISRAENGRVGLDVSQKAMKERSGLIQRGLDRKYVDQNDVLAMTPLIWSREAKGYVPNETAGTKAYERTDGNQFLREAYAGNTSFWRPQFLSVPGSGDVFSKIEDLQGSIIVGGVLADPNRNTTPRVHRRLKFAKSFDPVVEERRLSTGDQAVAHLKKNGAWDLIPADVQERIAKGETALEEKFRTAPEIVTHRKRWIMVDVDDQELPTGIDMLENPDEAARWYTKAALPPEFHDARIGIHFSSSAGFRKDEKFKEGNKDLAKMTYTGSGRRASMHLFFELSDAHFPEDVHAFLEKHRKALGEHPTAGGVVIKHDLKLIAEPHHVHYVSDPIFKNVNDPLKGRRTHIAAGEQLVRLPKEVDGMWIRESGAMDRGASSDFRPAVVPNREAQPTLSATNNTPPMPSSGTGLNVQKRTSTRSRDPLQNLPSMTASGGKELLEDLPRTTQHAAYKLYEADPWVGGRNTESGCQATERLVAAIIDRRDYARSRGIGSESTHSKITETEIRRWAENAMDTAYRANAIPAFQDFKNLPQGPTLTEKAGAYMAALRGRVVTPGTKVVTDPRDGVEVLVDGSAGRNVIRADGAVLVDDGVAVIGHPPTPVHDCLLITDKERFFASLESRIPAVGVFGRATPDQIANAVQTASKRSSVFPIPVVSRKPTVRLDQGVDPAIGDALKARGFVLEGIVPGRGV